jgi:hypothetical protein
MAEVESIAFTSLPLPFHASKTSMPIRCEHAKVGKALFVHKILIGYAGVELRKMIIES